MQDECYMYVSFLEMYCDYKNSSQINFILDVDNSCVQYFCNKFTSQRVKYKAEGILGIPDTCHCKGKNSFYHHWPTSWFIVRNFSTINCWFAFYFKWWRVVVNWFRKSLLMLYSKKGVAKIGLINCNIWKTTKFCINK